MDQPGSVPMKSHTAVFSQYDPTQLIFHLDLTPSALATSKGLAQRSVPIQVCFFWRAMRQSPGPPLLAAQEQQAVEASDLQT